MYFYIILAVGTYNTILFDVKISFSSRFKEVSNILLVNANKAVIWTVYTDELTF